MVLNIKMTVIVRMVVVLVVVVVVVKSVSELGTHVMIPVPALL